MNTTESFEMFHTMNLKTATALVTLGFKKISTEIIIRADGKESMVFWFESTCLQGLSAGVIYHDMTKGVNEMESEDHESQLLATLSEHQKYLFYKAITNYMRCYAASRDGLINEIRSTPRKIAVEKDGRTALLPENASAETKRKISQIL